MILLFQNLSCGCECIRLDFVSRYLLFFEASRSFLRIFNIRPTINEITLNHYKFYMRRCVFDISSSVYENNFILACCGFDYEHQRKLANF